MNFGRQTPVEPRWRPIALALLCLPLWLASCSRPEEQKETSVLAWVGDEEITLDEFNEELERRVAAGRPITGKDAVLQDMIREEVLEQRARAAGLDKDPEFQRQIRKMLIGKLREQELNLRLRDVEVTEGEITAEYEQHLEEHARPAKIRLAMLYLKTAPKMGEEKVAELRDQLELARENISKGSSAVGRGVASKGFGSLAISNSEDQASRYRGGDIGWLDIGRFDYRWPQEVLSAGYALKDHGDFSGVIETPTGLYVVMKVDSREKVMTPLADVEKGIKNRLILRKREELESAFEERMKKSVSIEINHEALASVTVPDRAAAKPETPTPPNLQ